MVLSQPIGKPVSRRQAMGSRMVRLRLIYRSEIKYLRKTGAVLNRVQLPVLYWKLSVLLSVAIRKKLPTSQLLTILPSLQIQQRACQLFMYNRSIFQRHIG
jgi:hypothetical protein